MHEMKERHTYPKVAGQIEISHGKQGVFIGGDPEGLRSLANLLTFLADVDQESIPHLPDGDRDHTHLTPGCHLSEDSEETEVCRLDAKGTGDVSQVIQTCTTSTSTRTLKGRRRRRPSSAGHVRRSIYAER